MRYFIFVLVAWLFVFPSAANAQNDWTAVQQLPPGSRLRIQVSNEVIDARLREATSNC